MLGGDKESEAIDGSSSSDVACVVLVSPSYHGVISDVGAAAAICAQYQVPLIVDEAHGSHLPFLHASVPLLEVTLNQIADCCSSSVSSTSSTNSTSCSFFDSYFSPTLDEYSKSLRSAVARGADVAVQSTHKTLTSLTQSAMLHLGQSGAAWGSSSNSIGAGVGVGENAREDKGGSRSDDRSMEVPKGTQSAGQGGTAAAVEAEVAIAEALAILSTSSPSALLLASLDSSRKFFAAPDSRFLSKQNARFDAFSDASESAKSIAATATTTAVTAATTAATAATELSADPRLVPEPAQTAALQSSGGSRRLRRAVRLASHVRHRCRALGLALFEPPGFAIDPLRVVVLVPPLPPELTDSNDETNFEGGHEQSELVGEETSGVDSPDEATNEMRAHDGSGAFAVDEDLIEKFGVYCELPEECARVAESTPPPLNDATITSTDSPLSVLNGGALTFAFGAGTTASHARQLLRALGAVAERASRASSVPSLAPSASTAAAVPHAVTEEVSTPANGLGTPLSRGAGLSEIQDGVEASAYCMTPRDAFLSPRVTVGVQLLFYL